MVNLLLGNEGSRVYEYPSSAPVPSFSPLGRVSTGHNRQSSFHLYPSGVIGGGAGILDDVSGRESPRVLTHASSTGSFLHQQSQQQQRSSAASSTGGGSVSKLMRKGLLAELGSAQERELAALQRFREVSYLSVFFIL